ncbi:MAG: hypothetical protein CMN76_06435 [Spirochaetaceae bacterium]|nr:hypothetical protein [Spirochaetaceae bacterium]
MTCLYCARGISNFDGKEQDMHKVIANGTTLSDVDGPGENRRVSFVECSRCHSVWRLERIFHDRPPEVLLLATRHNPELKSRL